MRRYFRISKDCSEFLFSQKNQLQAYSKQAGVFNTPCIVYVTFFKCVS